MVIPVYNGEKYIKDAVNSVLGKQEKLEIILVDDGSADRSGEICDAYAAQYDHVLVFHTENRGAGHARNLGIHKASGDFILFLDADDRIGGDFFDHISCLEALSHCDVIFFKIIKLLESGTRVPMNEGFTDQNITGRSKEEVLKNIAGFDKFPASCAGKLINRKFMIENNITFPGESFGEDVDLTLQLLCRGNQFGYYDKGSYLYRKHQNTRSAKGKKESVADLLAILQSWLCISRQSPYRQYILSYLSYEYAMLFPFLGSLRKRERKPFIGPMRRLQYLLRFGRTKKLKAIRLCTHLLGIEKTALLLNAYVSRRDQR